MLSALSETGGLARPQGGSSVTDQFPDPSPVSLSAWWCGNCAMFWPEPFCDYCGKTLKGIDRPAAEPTEGNAAGQTGEV